MRESLLNGIALAGQKLGLRVAPSVASISARKGFHTLWGSSKGASTANRLAAHITAEHAGFNAHQTVTQLVGGAAFNANALPAVGMVAPILGVLASESGNKTEKMFGVLGAAAGQQLGSAIGSTVLPAAASYGTRNAVISAIGAETMFSAACTSLAAEEAGVTAFGYALNAAPVVTVAGGMAGSMLGSALFTAGYFGCTYLYNHCKGAPRPRIQDGDFKFAHKLVEDVNTGFATIEGATTSITSANPGAKLSF